MVLGAECFPAPSLALTNRRRSKQSTAHFDSPCLYCILVGNVSFRSLSNLEKLGRCVSPFQNKGITCGWGCFPNLWLLLLGALFSYFCFSVFILERWEFRSPSSFMWSWQFALLDEEAIKLWMLWPNGRIQKQTQLLKHGLYIGK